MVLLTRPYRVQLYPTRTELSNYRRARTDRDALGYRTSTEHEVQSAARLASNRLGLPPPYLASNQLRRTSEPANCRKSSVPVIVPAETNRARQTTEIPTRRVCFKVALFGCTCLEVGPPRLFLQSQKAPIVSRPEGSTQSQPVVKPPEEKTLPAERPGGSTQKSIREGPQEQAPIPC